MSFKTKTILERHLVSLEVEEEIRKIWEDYELGNDYYYFPWDSSLNEEYPFIAKYIKDSGEDEENILIYFWW